MASPKAERVVILILAAAAIDELAEIWEWNAEHHDPFHATAYVAFLKQSIDSLSTRSDAGRQVGDHPDLRYVILRRKAKGHGHVAVYRVKDRSVHILHVFHTAQDWQSRLDADVSP
jgi:plasmid stabilization system protein ParE